MLAQSRPVISAHTFVSAHEIANGGHSSSPGQESDPGPQDVHSERHIISQSFQFAVAVMLVVKHGSEPPGQIKFDTEAFLSVIQHKWASGDISTQQLIQIIQQFINQYAPLAFSFDFLENFKVCYGYNQDERQSETNPLNMKRKTPDPAESQGESPASEQSSSPLAKKPRVDPQPVPSSGAKPVGASKPKHNDPNPFPMTNGAPYMQGTRYSSEECDKTMFVTAPTFR
ncbi:hypothetical protein BWQ96_01871 [Gracilariopsis chorda]|uniref:Uncharacterized protein n=1 Tax=Gracilariopsis chorda TaxID=448386 RepID=A0A2V3J1U5_9FLOR|nr:hypothetical protein BWQ96_01871 [Gracilariopsis chorda]|eukprot:PXF48411.1 hypothetical protein BWQ96_01871 [Gracilariopsis chorda]